jgi:hypothetical protein
MGNGYADVTIAHLTIYTVEFLSVRHERLAHAANAFLRLLNSDCFRH